MPTLEGGDMLIVAGDLTARDQEYEYRDFTSWLVQQRYKKKIFIGGNHDNCLVNKPVITFSECEYLCDSGTEFGGLKIWGSPWTKTFPGMNPHCKAFTVDTEKELTEKWILIPPETNILITHSPSFGNYDWIKTEDQNIGPSVGSMTLWMYMLGMIPHLKLHVTGHIHEAYGNAVHANGIHLVNASHVNERYKPVNKPVRIIL
jgi:Icc-related predicted phosphoesterase